MEGGWVVACHNALQGLQLGAVVEGGGQEGGDDQDHREQEPRKSLSHLNIKVVIVYIVYSQAKVVSRTWIKRGYCIHRVQRGKRR